MPSCSFCELHRKPRKRGFCDPLCTSTYSACFFFLPHREACGFLLPCLGIKPVSPTVGAWSPNHWTSREVPTPLAFCLLPQPLLVPVTPLLSISSSTGLIGPQIQQIIFSLQAFAQAVSSAQETFPFFPPTSQFLQIFIQLLRLVKNI